jgi:hypothetical protein
MDKIKAAISHFKYGLEHDIYKQPVVGYANSAVAALEKQMPALVKHRRTFWYYAHSCPACGVGFNKEGLNYCPQCGQALDWSDYEKGLKYVR